MKILLLTRSLASGGTERQISILGRGLKNRGHDVIVVEFYGGGLFEKELLAAGVRLTDLKKRGRWRNLTFLVRLARFIRKERPDIIHSYGAVANILALCLRRVSPCSKIVWGVRASNVDLSQYDWAARTSYEWECALSSRADLIIVNSEAGKAYATQSGFPSGRMVVIHNGIELDRLMPGREAGLPLRRGWRIPDGSPLVGLVGRVDPMKDHGTFVRAASGINQLRPDVRFVCVGRTEGLEFSRVQQLVEELDIGPAFVWAGERSDMCAVYNSLDTLCLPSCFGEGFPNVVGEAMACGVPCVVTDVGDAADIVGQTGRVVPSRNPVALAEAILSLLADGRSLPDAALRRRISDRFGADRLVERTERELLALLGRAHCGVIRS